MMRKLRIDEAVKFSIPSFKPIVMLGSNGVEGRFNVIRERGSKEGLGGADSG
jgi:hypothetical protein